MDSNDGARVLGRLHDLNARLIEQIRSQAGEAPGSAKSYVYPHVCFADMQVAIIVAVLLLTMRYVLEHWMIPRLLPRYSSREHGKLAENVFYTGYYAVACAILAVLAQREQWIWKFLHLGDDRGVFEGIFQDMPPPKSDIVHLYYMVTLGFYSSATVFLLWFDTSRSDFNEFVLHHMVTLGLVTASYLCGYVRCGIALMALHDVGDVFLYLAKTLHYLGLAGVDTAVFAVFAVTFYGTRLVLLPRIAYALHVDAFKVMTEDATYNDWARNFETSFKHLAFFSLLIDILILLHCFWFCLILKMIYREVFLGKKISEEGDIREAKT
jgi:TLC domain